MKEAHRRLMSRPILGAWLLVGLMVAGACGGGETTPADSGDGLRENVERLAGLEPVAPDEEYRIGYTLPQFRDPFWVGVAYGIEDEAARAGVVVERALEAGSYLNLTEQLQQIDDMIQLQLDAILVAPVDRVGITPALDAAGNAGIPVIGAGNLGNSEAMDPGVTFSHIEFGHNAADFIGSQLDGEGKVVVLNGPEGADWAILRTDAFRERLAEEYPNVEIIDDQWSNVDRAEGQRITDDWIQRFGEDIDALFATVNLLAEGAVLSLRAGGLNGDAVVATSASTPDTVEMMKAGDIQFVGEERAVLVGRWAVQYAIRVLNGETDLPNVEPAEGNEPLPERVAYVPNDVYTAEDVEDIDPYVYEWAPPGWTPGSGGGE